MAIQYSIYYAVFMDMFPVEKENLTGNMQKINIIRGKK